MAITVESYALPHIYGPYWKMGIFPLRSAYEFKDIQFNTKTAAYSLLRHYHRKFLSNVRKVTN